MTRTEYFENAQTLLANGKVSEDVFWAMIENADVFTEEDGEDDIITYCDINECNDCPRYGDDCDGKGDEEDDGI